MTIENSLSPKNRGDYIYDTLKAEILDLRLYPGQIISENQICERFGVSRTPVRDALRLLQQQGFVTALPYKGIMITLLNFSNIKQLLYMRVAVERMVIRDFIKIKSPLLMEDINHLIRKQEAIILEPTFVPEQFYRLDAQMHSVWFEATQKSKLWEILQEQQLHYTRFRMLDFATETNFPRIISEHKAIFAQIESGDIDTLEEILNNHLCYALTRMRQIIEVDYKHYFEEDHSPNKFQL